MCTRKDKWDKLIESSDNLDPLKGVGTETVTREKFNESENTEKHIEKRKQSE